MKKFLLAASLLLTAIMGHAQEKMMSILKTDGTSIDTRVAELKQLSFLAVEQGTQGLMVKTTGGETVAVLFESNPVATISSGKLVIKSSEPDAVQVEISEIAEIVFGDASSDGIQGVKGFDYVLQEGSAVLRGMSAGTMVQIYTMDGRSIPTPPVDRGELRLSRATLGAGIYIVKVGTFTTKIQL